jgi:hypothetical protein
VEQLVNLLDQDRLPNPGSNVDSPETYLAEIVENETNVPAIRISAAIALSSLHAQKTTGIQNAMRANLIWEDALRQYKRRSFNGSNEMTPSSFSCSSP